MVTKESTEYEKTMPLPPMPGSIEFIRMLKEHFELGTVNVFTDNSTDVKRDQELVDWFMEKYAWLLDDPTVEVLYEKTDFGVGD